MKPMHRNTTRRNGMRAVALIALAATTAAGCAAGRAPLRAEMKPLELTAAQDPQEPALLTKNHFKGDQMGRVTEEDLRRILEAPVFLDEKARVGVVPVASRYAVDEDLPVNGVPGELTAAMEGTGHFEVASEVTTDWPAQRGISGLRELAARYRAEYLLLYRHRFVDRQWTNAWALMWLTFVGGFIVPHETIEVAGVLEATLFDVRTGTLLFTVHERVSGIAEENIWQNARKRREMKQGLLTKAARKLSDQVVDKIGRLVAARPERSKESAPAMRQAARPAPTPVAAEPEQASPAAAQ